MIIAAIKPTIPASPRACTNATMFDAISPTNGTFPPNRERTIPNPSNDIITLVRELNVAANPDNIFIATSLLFFTKNSKTNHFVLQCDTFNIFKVWSTSLSVSLNEN